MSDITDFNYRSDQNQIVLLQRERDALKVEYESRAIWIAKMNKILGYDNSDGFHSEPGPHDLAKQLVTELDTLKLKLEVAKVALESVSAHRSQDRDGNHVLWIGETTFLQVSEALEQLSSG